MISLSSGHATVDTQNNPEYVMQLYQVVGINVMQVDYYSIGLLRI